MGESINLVNNFNVRNVIFNIGPYNEIEEELVSVLKKRKINFYRGYDNLNIDGYRFYFLNTKIYDNENDNSNVIYFDIDGYKFLFMGDAGVQREKDISEKYNISNVDVLKVGHHGSKTSSSEKFINKIKPKYSIISVGKNNRYNYPNKEVLDVLNKTKIYRTDINGSIEIKLTKNKYFIQTCFK